MEDIRTAFFSYDCLVSRLSSVAGHLGGLDDLIVIDT